MIKYVKKEWNPNLKLAEGTKVFSGLFGGKLAGLFFPGGRGFLGGTTGAGLWVLISGEGLSTETQERKHI